MPACGVTGGRLLFTTRPLAGHYGPVLELAQAAKAAGHAVAFATGEPYDERARSDGFEAFTAGPSESFRAEWAPRFPGFDGLVGDDMRRFFLTRVFADLELVPRADAVDGVVDAWRPDLVVSEVAELPGPLVAAAHGLPSASVSYGALITLALLRETAAAAAPHWSARGLEPDPYAGLFRGLYVDTCPPSLQNPEIADVPAPVQRLRPAAAEVGPTGDPPSWLAALPDPLVYVTLGTVWNRDLDVFRCVLDALRDEPGSVVVTVGRENDPDALGPQPPNVAVHRFVPQAVLLPRCAAVVAHGGAGTMLGALASGVPLLVLPQGADQWANAERVVASGAGRRLLRDEVSVPAVRDAVRAVRDEPAHRAAARRVQADIAAMPPAADAVRRLEALLAG